MGTAGSEFDAVAPISSFVRLTGGGGESGVPVERFFFAHHWTNSFAWPEASNGREAVGGANGASFITPDAPALAAAPARALGAAHFGPRYNELCDLGGDQPFEAVGQGLADNVGTFGLPKDF